MKKILVTGAAGFIGQHTVARLLRDGFAVQVLVRNSVWPVDWNRRVEVVVGDVRDPDAAKKALAGCDTVLHLAGKAHDAEELHDTGEHEQITVIGTQNLLAAAQTAGVRTFLFLSSLSVYGPSTHAQQDETAPCGPVTAYGWAKLKAETCLFEHGQKFGIAAICLRPALVYGPGCRGNLIRMIDFIDRGLFPPIPEVGNRRSMVHVADLVEAVLLAATKPLAAGKCYLVTDGKPYSTRELYELICRALGKPVPRWHVPLWTLKALGRTGDVIGRVRGKRFLFDSDALDKLVGSAWYSSEKISRELGYRPTITLADAMPEMIAWYRKGNA